MENQKSIDLNIIEFFKEDDLFKNDFYNLGLPNDTVECHLKFKTVPMIICGLPYLISTFRALGTEIPQKQILSFEGKKIQKEEEIIFNLPFNHALNGERIALNLLQRASSIATMTHQFVQKASQKGIKILDTRKTLPGYRSLEKYAVRIGGGYNHRMSQVDAYMIKDNHKSFFGGLKQAFQFFQERGSFYTPIIVEIHSIEELKEAQNLPIKHLMLDNFSPEKIQEAIKIKKPEVTVEVSGGINLETLDSYLVEGVDAISVGQITYGAPPVDISLKYFRK